MARKRGPKTKYSENRGEAFIRLARQGKTAAEIAEALGVSRKTLSNWMRRNPELLLAVRQARRMADGLVEAALFSRATGYRLGPGKRLPPDTTAAMFWLRNRQPKRWREKNEGDVNVRVNNYAALSDEQLDARLAEIEAKRAPAPELAPGGPAPGDEPEPMPPKDE